MVEVSPPHPLAPSPPPPPAPPRPLSPLARRRAWTEPGVRVWWLLAVLVLGMILAFAADRLWARHDENRLIQSGLPLDAKVLGTPIHQTPGQTADAGDEATVSIPWHGQPTRVTGFLTRSTLVANTIPIHVDPTDPTRWTDRTTPTPLTDALLVGLMLLPIVPVLVAVAAVRRRGVARTWRDGSAVAAVVTDRRQTPVAPLSYAVRCALKDGDDRRVRTVYVPRGVRPPNKGDELWLLLPPGRGRAVAAAWFIGAENAEFRMQNVE